MENCRRFFGAYGEGFSDQKSVRVVEIGSQDVNGSLRSVAPSRFEYIGVDFVEGKGVDFVLQDPYQLPFVSDFADIVLSSSCFEHSEMFWITFMEIMRILKPHGLLYLNVPSNGSFHRYPVDCWRFYPDSGRALVSWAQRNSVNAALLESYISDQEKAIWNDFVGVFIKDEQEISRFPHRILDNFQNFRNGAVHGGQGFLKVASSTEDMTKLKLLGKIINDQGGVR